MGSLFRRLRLLLHRESADRELEEEMRSHLEMAASETGDADAARRAFGNFTLLKETSREMWGWRSLDALGRDIRYALRTLRRSPGFTTVAVLTLALGLGVNIAIFTLLYNVVLRPIQYRDVMRLVDVHLIQTSQRRGTVPMAWSYPKFDELRQRNRSFESLAAFRGRNFTLSGIGRAERVTGEIVSAGYFRMIGVNAAIGRVFMDEEDKPGAARPVILISDGLWRRAFGADAKVIGRTVRVDGMPMTIVGVLPTKFRGETSRADLWAPMSAYFIRNLRPGRLVHNLQAIGRLKPGVTPQQADVDVRALVARMENENTGTGTRQAKFSGGVKPLIDARVDPLMRKSLWILQAATLCVLLIGCLNLANLLLGRGAARSRELAIRLALGTSRGALIRQLLVEPLLLAAAGGIAGLSLAAWGLKLLVLLSPAGDTNFWFDYTRLINTDALNLQQPLVMFGIALSLVTVALFGVLPAWQATRQDVSKALKRGLTAGGTPNLRLRKALVTGQMALALVLLAGAGLMLRSFASRLATHIGAETRRIVTMRVQSASRDTAVQREFYEGLRGRAAALPGVESAAVSDGIPVYGPDWGTSLRLEGGKSVIDTGVYSVSPEYFKLFRIPLIAGRLFDERDREGGPPVVVISETAARQFFPGETPVGRQLDDPSKDKSRVEVVGVVGDVKYRPPEAKERPILYYSSLQRSGSGFLAVRTSGNPTAIVAALRGQVRALDPEAPVYDVRTMEQQVGAVTWRSRFGTILLGMFASLALALAALGIYGVFSYMVVARTHDIGIRMALGARSGSILRVVLREGVLLCAAALALGLPAALALTRLLSSQLYRIAATDPVTFIVAPALLTFVALLACYIPARRASRIDPMEALRHE